MEIDMATSAKFSLDFRTESKRLSQSANKLTNNYDRSNKIKSIQKSNSLRINPSISSNSSGYSSTLLDNTTKRADNLSFNNQFHSQNQNHDIYKSSSFETFEQKLPGLHELINPRSSSSSNLNSTFSSPSFFSSSSSSSSPQKNFKLKNSKSSCRLGLLIKAVERIEGVEFDQKSFSAKPLKRKVVSTDHHNNNTSQQTKKSSKLFHDPPAISTQREVSYPNFGCFPGLTEDFLHHHFDRNRVDPFSRNLISSHLPLFLSTNFPQSQYTFSPLDPIPIPIPLPSYAQQFSYQ